MTIGDSCGPPGRKAPAGYEYLELPHALLVLGENVRRVVEDEESSQLAESVRRHGQLTPGTAYWDELRQRAHLVSGYRRFRATLEAGIPCFRVLVYDRAPGPQERLLLQLTENLHRKDLTAIERGMAYRAILGETGMSARELAVHLAVAHSTVLRDVSLTELSDDLQAAIQGGTLSPAHGRALARLGDPDIIDRVYEEVRSRALTAEQTERLVSARLRPRKKNTRAAKPTRRKFALGGFEAVVETRRVVIRVKGSGKRSGQAVDLIGAIESLLARLREESGGASEPAATSNPDDGAGTVGGGEP